MVVTDKKIGYCDIKYPWAHHQATITRIFMVQGTIIGVIGTVSGAILGIVFASGISGFVGLVKQCDGTSFV